MIYSRAADQYVWPSGKGGDIHRADTRDGPDLHFLAGYWISGRKLSAGYPARIYQFNETLQSSNFSNFFAHMTCYFANDFAQSTL